MPIVDVKTLKACPFCGGEVEHGEVSAPGSAIMWPLPTASKPGGAHAHRQALVSLQGQNTPMRSFKLYTAPVVLRPLKGIRCTECKLVVLEDRSSSDDPPAEG